MRRNDSDFRRRQEIIDKLQNKIDPGSFTPRALYDGGAIMYASHGLNLSGGDGIFVVPLTQKPGALPGTPGVFEVRITRVGDGEINPTHLRAMIQGTQSVATPKTAMATNLLQLLIRQAPNLAFPNNGRGYFTNADFRPLEGGLELWRGYFQSVRPTLGRMLVNVDTSITAVRKSGPLIDVALNILTKPNSYRDRPSPRSLEAGPHEDNFRQLQQFLKNVRITVRTDKPSRKRIIYKLVERGGMYEFDKDGAPCTVARHFQQAHGITLQFPKAFGVCITHSRAERAVIIPAELCEVVPGQLYKKKIPEALFTKDVVNFATLPPPERLSAIQQGISKNHNIVMASPVTQYADSPFIRDAGMQISTNPIVVGGRVLDTPDMEFGKQEIVKPAGGSWNVVRKTLKDARTLKTWAVINYEAGLPPKIPQRFVETLMACCSNLGMTVHNPRVQAGNAQAPEDALKAILEMALANKVHLDLVLVILPRSAGGIRAKVKQWGDVHHGIMTQCVREDKLWDRGQYKANDQYCNNVAIKINARLGGDNSVPKTNVMNQLRANPYMVVGADVGHPGPGVKTQPSVASLVWSWDQWACRYSAVSRVQSPRTEMISDLKAMFTIALGAFSKKNRIPPKRIFLFRDGVSEGELEQVASLEIQAIKEAIDQFWVKHKLPSAKPCLTFIVVGKRHHIRFFPQDSRDSDKSDNCHAGFIADNGLSSPMAHDFYLQSHGGLKGTSRPGHYMILLDENFRLAIDDLQELCFALCHVYAKATRSVSIPAPVYYADLVCSRAKFYFSEELGYADTNMTASSNEEFDLERWQGGYNPIHRDIITAMYFL
jgi:eukaryotic translation initiation factor 2C